MDVSIFDLDRTLTRIGTYTPFLIFAALHRAPWRLVLLPIWLFAICGYGVGALSRKQLKQAGFFLFIGKQAPGPELTRIARRFATLMLTTNIPAAARAHLAAEQARGAVLVLATAAPDIYAREIGVRLGFRIIVATQQQRFSDGAISFRIDGDNCYGATKLQRVEQACAAEPLLRGHQQISFYSDSASDAPLFGWAKAAFAVNPSRRLRKLAAQRGWPILHFT